MMGRRIRPNTWHRHLEVSPSREALKVPLIRPASTAAHWPLRELGTLGLRALGCWISNNSARKTARQPADSTNGRLVFVKRGACKVLTKWGATPQMQQIMEGGGHLGFIADQNAGDGGLFVPFFGRLASAYKSIALLAMKYDAPILVAMARRTEQAIKYEFVIGDIIEPDDWKSQADPLYYLTARYTRGLEKLVTACPGTVPVDPSSMEEPPPPCAPRQNDASVPTKPNPQFAVA